MRIFAAILPLWLLCSTAFAEPSIVGSPNVDAADNTIRVKANQPPWLTLSVKDAPADAVETWSGPIGPGQVGFEGKAGVGVTTGIPGTYVFRCLLQIPKEGLDDVQILDSTVIVEGTGPVPPPDVVPVPQDFPAKLTAAVKATKPEQHAGLGKVADLHLLVADQVKGGLLTTPQQVVAMTSLLSGAASSAWADIDASVVQPHLRTLTLAKAADYEPVWRQIAAAIKAGLTDLPPPVVVDPPLPVTGLHVLVVEEMDDRRTLPASQVDIFTSTTLRKWFVENNVQWRMFDDDVDTAQLDGKWKAALERPRQSLPWVVASNGQTGFEGPLPKDTAALIQLLEKYK